MNPSQASRKLTEYRQMEVDIQKQWKESKIFEVDAPISGDRSGAKYFATFPYPYMNGKLHLGHSYSISKVEFAIAYQRLLGKSCLFPLGFHCTGMPILACADKLKREVEQFGYPPKFPQETVDSTKPLEPINPDDSEFKNKSKSKKSKAQSKTGTAKYQWQIMRENIFLRDADAINLSGDELEAKIDEEILKFVDPTYWFTYFPLEAMRDLDSLGLGIDWRRSFITTDVNPFYDSFVRWQFLKLKQKDKIKFGKRYTIYSPKDQQPCMDHDRSSGEGVLPLEYTVMKFVLVDGLPNVQKPVSLLGSTLKPLNLERSDVFVNPKANYIAFSMGDGIGICSARAARNMSYQNLTPKLGQVDTLFEISGQDLCGKALKCPITHETISISPKNIKDDKGTGIEFSPEKPGEITKISDAIVYMEPEGEVISRSGDICVVALCDQWYLDYGNESWKLHVKSALDRLETYSSETRNRFDMTLDWLHEHACSRTYGLGSKLPWDDSWLIESLSDSTIYMAYYTVAHLLQSGNLKGSDKTSPLGIKPNEMTADVWDYVFLGDESCLGSTTISKENLDILRREFLFWYPMDLRSSGKDLVPNHLTFSLYHHCAIWDQDPNMWPKSFRANGHLQLNGEKMSKSTGNFLTLEGAINLYGADAVRFALADAGDGIDDANFVDKQAEVGLLKLFNYIKWCEETLDSMSTLRTGDLTSFADKTFDNEMNKLVIETKEFYDKMMFREALRSGFFVYQELRTKYKELCGPQGLHGNLIRKFIETQAVLICPICPHAAQKIWTLLGHQGFIANSKWPQIDNFDDDLSRAFSYLNDSVHEFRVRYKAFQASAKSRKSSPATMSTPPNTTKAIIFVAKTFPSWQATICRVLHDLFIQHNGELPDNKIISKELVKCESLKKHMKKVMPFAEFRKQIFLKIGEKAFDSALPFDEFEILEENMSFVKSSLELDDITIKESIESDDPKIVEDCSPSNPAIKFIF